VAADVSLSGKLFSYLHAYSAPAFITYATAVARGQVWRSPGGDAVAQAELAALSEVLRDIVGNPFRPPPTINPGWLRWGGGTVRRLAAAIYTGRHFAELPILADALEDAGCTDPDLLAHCREQKEHARGCWALDGLLAKEL
jgi:hypothetical protein